MHTGRLYDCLYVDQAKKRVYVFQVSSQGPKRHAFKANTLYDVMNNLQFFADGNSEYTMVYVHCTQSSFRYLHKCELQTTGESEVGNEELILVTNRLENVLVAYIHFFPGEPYIVSKLCKN